MTRARDRLLSLRGKTVPAITVEALEPRDAPFLGRNISKLSPFVSNLLERAVLEELTDVPGEHGYTWKRQDPGFPDAGIFDPAGATTGCGIEVKAWYALSSEITGRFKNSQLHLGELDIDVILVTWVMSDIVFGRPLILDVAVINALSIAKARDSHYHQPPHYLVIQPEDTSDRGVQQQQTNVAGYVLQPGSAPTRDTEVMIENMGKVPVPHDDKTRALNRYLWEKLNYRLDTNFAKIDRVAHPDIEAFKTRTLESDFRGQKVKQWRRTLADLDSTNDTRRVAAEAKVKALYG